MINTRFIFLTLLSFPVIAQLSQEIAIPEQQENPYADRNHRWLKEVWQKKGSATEPHAVNGYEVVAADSWNTILANMFTKTGVSDGASVFDFGCGGGSSCLVLSGMHKNLTFYGIDYSPKLIERAQKDIAHGTFWTQSITEPLKVQPSAKVDLALCMGVFLYLNSPDEVEKSILTMASVVKPGGKILLSDISDSEKKELADRIRGVVHTKIQDKLSNDNTLDHLYLPRSFFSDVAQKLNAQVEFVEFTDVDPAGTYPNGAYRFNAIITLPTSATHESCKS